MNQIVWRNTDVVESANAEVQKLRVEHTGKVDLVNAEITKVRKELEDVKIVLGSVLKEMTMQTNLVILMRVKYCRVTF